MTVDREQIRVISETLFTGGYDGTEGQEGSRDRTWTDFGIVCGIAERLGAALEQAERERDGAHKWVEEHFLAEGEDVEDRTIAAWLSTVYDWGNQAWFTAGKAEARLAKVPALAKWTRHHSQCTRVLEAGECDCGLNDAWRDLRIPEAE